MGVSEQKTIEIRLIQEFIAFMGLRVICVVPGEEPGPDAFATVLSEGKQHEIGIEHTDYHVDAPHGTPSPGRRIDAMWREVQEHLRSMAKGHPNLAHVSGLVFLRKDHPPRKSDARKLAEELVQFALQHPVPPDGRSAIKSFPEKCPFLRAHIRTVNLHGTGAACWLSWECAETKVSYIGVSSDRLYAIVKDKAEKARKYHWGTVDERWLLVCAPGHPIVTSAGPKPDQADLLSDDLASACECSGFGRIFFWERMSEWHIQLWPCGYGSGPEIS